ncbi:zinc metalloproteinase nas-4-like [Diretmus argenteus]
MAEDRNAVESLWSEACVPYTIDPRLADRKANIFAAFKMISDVTCIRFREHTTELNYLRILKGRGCASYVGCSGGDQPLHYSPSCTMGNLCHEIIHALGLHHEHTRPDRDQHISVQWQNIMSRRQKNFKVKYGNTMNLPYDINSIMHYGQFFFTADKYSPTIVARHGPGQMGQRTHLSPLDIRKINKLYHCDERVKEAMRAKEAMGAWRY